MHQGGGDVGGGGVSAGKPFLGCDMATCPRRASWKRSAACMLQLQVANG